MCVRVCVCVCVCVCARARNACMCSCVYSKWNLLRVGTVVSALIAIHQSLRSKLPILNLVFITTLRKLKLSESATFRLLVGCLLNCLDHTLPVFSMQGNSIHLEQEITCWESSDI